ncbi:DUF424 family protein [Candidatus Woesearchaeota archaeon]|nr:DUF424 family protein [Candidatus Woesearchaeota archaeon]
MKFIVAKKNGPHGLLLVVTDAVLLGKKFEEGKLQLDVSKEFYQGEEKSKEEVVNLIKTAQHVHLTGKEAVALGINTESIQKKKVLFVAGIPHAEGVFG